jgi:hypothetical protein
LYTSQLVSESGKLLSPEKTVTGFVAIYVPLVTILGKQSFIIQFGMEINRKVSLSKYLPFTKYG